MAVIYEHILIPTDGSKLSGRAVKRGVALAQALGARVTGLTVTPPFRFPTLGPLMSSGSPVQYERDSRMIAKEALDAVSKAADAAGVPCAREHVVHGQPFRAIIRTAARRRCGLIVMASHGRRGVAGVLLGSETAKVLTHSKVPVLVCR
jgi:nucleotide-binding universal stress UspA family protein